MGGLDKKSGDRRERGEDERQQIEWGKLGVGVLVRSGPH